MQIKKLLDNCRTHAQSQVRVGVASTFSFFRLNKPNQMILTLFHFQGFRHGRATLLLFELHQHLLQHVGHCIGRVEEGDDDALPQYHRLLPKVL